MNKARLLKRFMVGPRRAAAKADYRLVKVAAEALVETLEKLAAEVEASGAVTAEQLAVPEIAAWRGGPREWLVYEWEGVRKVWRLYPMDSSVRLMWWSDGAGESAAKTKYHDWLKYWVARSTQ